MQLQPMIPPKNFDSFPPDWGMLRRFRLDTFGFFFEKKYDIQRDKVKNDVWCSEKSLNASRPSEHVISMKEVYKS